MTYAEFSTLQMDEALESLRQASRTRRLLTGLAIVVAINLFLYFKVHRRVKRLLTAVESVSQGTMTSVVPVEEQDELGELAGTFNDMVRKIREATHDNTQLTESLRAMNDSLQLKVSEATAEVLQKNRALAHTNELLSAAQRDAARAQRLSAIGQMAATVAHKIGTPLTALSGHIQLMAEDPTLSTESRQRLETVEAQIERTSKIIQDMLLYARRPEPVRSPLDLNACVAECLALFRPEFERRKITLVTEWSQHVEKVEADVQQLQEVFNNLIENALDAMPAGGTLYTRISPHTKLRAAGPSNLGRRWNSWIQAAGWKRCKWPRSFSRFSRRKRRGAARDWGWRSHWKQYGRTEVKSRWIASREKGRGSRSYFQPMEERADAPTISRDGSGR